ncbi:N-6 DNA methylase [Fluviicola sp. SGL-29]|nr:N-6 DNA methylase [Fluviicola sp. SGL-29]
MTYVDFFSDLGFDFNVDLKPKAIDIEKEATLSQKLKNSVFFYKSPNNTNTSFYLVTSSLETTELEQFRKYVWNKNDADIIFYYANDADEVRMLYAKYSPIVSNSDSVLRIFSTSQNDLEKLDSIKRWQFDSGAFWLNFQNFYNRSKHKSIDKELVAVLDALKKHLSTSLLNLIAVEKDRDVAVQALIDRTLYIKYLEDRHIINSYFYEKYFQDSNLNYQKLLEKRDKKGINRLFVEIHKIFNNSLFDTPKIEERFLTDNICKAIADSFNHNIASPQLRLFDFSFDVLPIEFISYIYEVFLSGKQKANGIYYTPKKLAQLIIDDVIPDGAEIGSILDPSCGSGMFLIVGFKRLLEIAKKDEPENDIDKIKFRLQLLSENIFGVEKQITAQRFTIFSLSLQIFDGINAEEIKRFIANELKQNKKITLFNDYNFHQNILHQNTLDVENKAFDTRKFKYIVGNPPFVRKEVSEDAKAFTNKYRLNFLGNEIIAKDIIDGYQISQCFLLKIKEWSDESTRFGFVSNSSNFYNEAQNFQKFFYSNYGIEKIYELSKVKKILFENAKESVVAIIFTNNFDNHNLIDYYPVDLGLFSDKPFELLIIQEDKVIGIVQDELSYNQIRLRDFLVGNEYDRQLLYNLSTSNTIEEYLTTDKNFSSYKGLDRLTNNRLLQYYNIKGSLGKNELAILHQKYANEKYLNNQKTDYYNTPYIHKPENKLIPFCISGIDGYVNAKDINNENFQRVRNSFIYKGDKILINKFGKRVQAVYVKEDLFFSNLIYVVKLNNSQLYFFFTAIINSDLINYFIVQKYKSRTGDNFSNIGTETIKNIPIPKQLEVDLVSKISILSEELATGKYEYSEKEQELNELIYDLYELSYWEKQRIRDYFLPEQKIGKNKKILESYKNTLKEIIGFYFENPINIDEAPAGFNLIVIKISFGNGSSPNTEKVKKYLLNEIFEQNPNANFLASQEKIFGKDCVYIIKEDINKNWTETKAFEDGQDILKRLIPNENGERIH